MDITKKVVVELPLTIWMDRVVLSLRDIFIHYRR